MGRFLICAGCLLMLAGALAGCAGLGETPSERWHRWQNVFAQDMGALADDIDYVAQTHRPTRLTKVQQR